MAVPGAQSLDFLGEPGVARQQHHGLLAHAELAEEKLVVAELSGREEKQHGCHAPERILAGADAAQMPCILPGPVVEAEDFGQGWGDSLPAWLHGGDVGGAVVDRRD